MYKRLCIDSRGREAKPAVIDPKTGPLTYRELGDAVRLRASELQRHGVRQGTIVALCMPSGADYIAYTYAIWSCGACVVPVPGTLCPAEVVVLCKELDVEMVVWSAATWKSGFGGTEGAIELSTGGFLSGHRNKNDTGDLPIGTGPAFIRFTSGTTGSAKGVILSATTICERVEAVTEVLDIRADDVVLWMLPMAHHFTSTVVTMLSLGATIVVCNGLGPDDAVRRALGTRATLWFATPAQYAMAMPWVRVLSGSCIRLAISVASRLSPELAQNFRQTSGIPLSQAYGIIEVGIPCLNNYPDRAPTAVGKPGAHYRVRLVDVGLGSKAQRVYLAGKGMFDGYYRPRKSASEVLEDGWFNTGDLGYTDDLGLLHISGREKNVIDIAGLKFFPEEVEQVLLTHPAVSEAFVFTEPSDIGCDVLTAHIVTSKTGSDATEQDLMIYCGQFLSKEKIPRQIVQVHSLARTPSGKLVRRHVSQPAGSNTVSDGGSPC